MGGVRLVFAGALLAAVASGCGIATVVGPTPDAMADWSVTPLPPDPQLAMRAVTGSGTTCSLDPAGGPTRLLLQDRRTAGTAGFLLSNTTRFGSCLVSSSTNGASGGSGPSLGAMSGLLSIDDIGSSSSGSGETLTVWELGGRVAPVAIRVVVVLADGHQVVASLMDGYWMAWWPKFGPASHVVATDSNGAQLADVQVTK